MLRQTRGKSYIITFKLDNFCIFCYTFCDVDSMPKHIRSYGVDRVRAASPFSGAQQVSLPPATRSTAIDQV